MARGVTPLNCVTLSGCQSPKCMQPVRRNCYTTSPQLILLHTVVRKLIALSVVRLRNWTEVERRHDFRSLMVSCKAVSEIPGRKYFYTVLHLTLCVTSDYEEIKLFCIFSAWANIWKILWSERPKVCSTHTVMLASISSGNQSARTWRKSLFLYMPLMLHHVHSKARESLSGLHSIDWSKAVDGDTTSRSNKGM